MKWGCAVILGTLTKVWMACNAGFGIEDKKIDYSKLGDMRNV